MVHPSLRTSDGVNAVKGRLISVVPLLDTTLLPRVPSIVGRIAGEQAPGELLPGEALVSVRERGEIDGVR